MTSTRQGVAVRGVWVLGLCVLVLAGCGGSGASRSPATSSGPVGQRVPDATAGTPGCSGQARSGARLSGIRTAMLTVPPEPFGVVTTADGRFSFVSSPSGITVLADSGPVPRVVRVVRLPTGEEALGATLTHSGQYLLAADRSGAAVLSVARLTRGAAHPLLGVIAHGRVGGAIEVVTSPDDRFAFITLEGAARIAVFDLQRALSSEFRSSGFVGDIPTGLAPVGMAISPAGRWLYVTSELRAGAGPPVKRSREPQGTLSVIDLRRAEVDPAGSARVTVVAGCEPVRVAVAPDGQMVWVTARGSDRLLGFAASRLIGHDPAHALEADVLVGAAPVGLTMADHGRLVIVADSNRFSAPHQHAGLTVVDTSRALDGGRAVLGSLPTGSFPREMATEPGDRTLLVTNFGSAQLEAVNLARLATLN